MPRKQRQPVKAKASSIIHQPPPVIARDLPRPAPQFDCGQFLQVSTDVCESGILWVSGREWGPDNRLIKQTGWFYMLKRVPKGGFPMGSMGIAWPRAEIFTMGEGELAKLVQGVLS
jgi:hypothetical protein